MKKLNIFFVVIVMIAVTFVSCDNNKPKTPSLKSQIDSLNYAFGVANGHGIKQYYLAADSAHKDSLKIKIASLLKGIKDGMAGDVEGGNLELMDLGKNIGNSLKEQAKTGLLGDSSLKVDIDLIKQGLVNGMKGFKGELTLDKAQVYLNTTMQKMQQQKMEKEYLPNKKAGEAFLAANKSKAGVITTASGLQYQVIKKGNGPLPTDTSRVKVNYVGTLIDGTEFDSSAKHGGESELYLNGVIKGWSEGLQLMPVGSKYKFFIPQELAYGVQGQGQIKPFSALIFEVELVSIEK